MLASLPGRAATSLESPGVSHTKEAISAWSSPEEEAADHRGRRSMSSAACWRGTWEVEPRRRIYSRARAGVWEGGPGSVQRWLRRDWSLSWPPALLEMNPYGGRLGMLLKELLPCLLCWPWRVASHPRRRVRGRRCPVGKSAPDHCGEVRSYSPKQPLSVALLGKPFLLSACSSCQAASCTDLCLASGPAQTLRHTCLSSSSFPCFLLWP